MMKGLLVLCWMGSVHGWSSFMGTSLTSSHQNGSLLDMRKQKASDRRTRRRQRSGEVALEDTSITAASTIETFTTNPMLRNQWNYKQLMGTQPVKTANVASGRGRSRKRTFLYQTLHNYRQHFLNLLTQEYKIEETQVLGRIQHSLDDPLGFEQAGHALFDMQLQLRGNLFQDEVYRLTKAKDASTPMLHHKFTVNDVIVLTAQPSGPGDVFSPLSIPTNPDATILEARILNMGPSYIDIAVPSGAVERTFDCNELLRLRMDRFVSPVSYQRMVDALAQITALTPPPTQTISMDPLLKDIVLLTHAPIDPQQVDLDGLAQRLAKPPMADSPKLARQSLSSQTTPFNGPQRAAILASLSRRFTLIHGPPGTGKTTVAAAIGRGFVDQCRTISSHSAVLACAFSNVGADNLLESLLKSGLNCVRIGKPSAVAEPLWEYTLEAAIDRDPDAQAALRHAAQAQGEGRTAAVQASIEAANVAATRALRQADVVVATCTGAADPRLLAACGMNGEEEVRQSAPDGLPPVSLPFVIVDEACQSLEPATLIPLVASNSCRSLVLLGDPCQLPPTVLSPESSEGLSLSLMERLAMILPNTSVIPERDETQMDSKHLNSLPVKQAVSLVRSRSHAAASKSYRKVYPGSVLLSYQYRMHPLIAAVPSALFYDSLLVTPDFVGPHRQCQNGGVHLIDVGGRDKERRGSPNVNGARQEEGTSYWNDAEAERVVSTLRDILSSKDEQISSIGVISPYTGQVQLIKSMISTDAELRTLFQSRRVSIEVKTVDGYQGRERDVIVFSGVRSNRGDNIGFLNDWRRMNVALTRARSSLYIVCDLDTLSGGSKYWDALRKWAHGVQCIVKDEQEE